MVFISSSGIQLSLAEPRASSSRRWARWWRPVVAINPLSRLGWQRLFAPVCQKAGEKPAMPWLAKSRIFAPYSKLCQVVSKSMCTRASTSSVQMCWQSVSNSLQTHCLPSSRSWRSNSTKHAWTSSSGFRAQLLVWCQLRRPKTSGWKHLCSRCLPKEWHAWSTWAVPWCQWCVTIQPRRQLWRNVALRSRRPPSCRSFATSSSWSWGIASSKTAPWRLLRSLWEGSKSQSSWCRPLPSSRQKRVRRSLLLFRPTSFRVLWSLWVTRCLGSCFIWLRATISIPSHWLQTFLGMSHEEFLAKIRFLISQIALGWYAGDQVTVFRLICNFQSLQSLQLQHCHVALISIKLEGKT